MTSSRLTALLNELGDCLQAASDSGTSPQGSELQLHARIRTVLVSLFAECIDTKTGCVTRPLMAYCLLRVCMFMPRCVRKSFSALKCEKIAAVMQLRTRI